jgi:hypothetical protein
LYPKIKESSGSAPADHLIATSQFEPRAPRPPDLPHSVLADARGQLTGGPTRCVGAGADIRVNQLSPKMSAVIGIIKRTKPQPIRERQLGCLLRVQRSRYVALCRAIPLCRRREVRDSSERVTRHPYTTFSNSRLAHSRYANGHQPRGRDVRVCTLTERTQSFLIFSHCSMRKSAAILWRSYSCRRRVYVFHHIPFGLGGKGQITRGNRLIASGLCEHAPETDPAARSCGFDK